MVGVKGGVGVKGAVGGEGEVYIGAKGVVVQSRGLEVEVVGVGVEVVVVGQEELGDKALAWLLPTPFQEEGEVVVVTALDRAVAVVE